MPEKVRECECGTKFVEDEELAEDLDVETWEQHAEHCYVVAGESGEARMRSNYECDFYAGRE